MHEINTWEHINNQTIWYQMLSYKRENGGNEKLMGWGRGYHSQSLASWSGTSTTQICHTEFINSRASSTKMPSYQRKNFPKFPTPINEERKKDIDKQEFPDLFCSWHLSTWNSLLCNWKPSSSLLLVDLFHYCSNWFAKYLLWVMMKPVWITRISDLPFEKSVKLGFYCVKLNKFHP